jgi:BirA family biotin operon repressor/biotin-[acetyl-CoA-carboxylase] ligase
MNAPREVWDLDATAIGRKVLVYDRVGSTNTLAVELASRPDAEPLAILAAEQTAGRGQHSRTWTAAPGSSVLMSVLLFPPDFLRRPPVLTAWAAVSVCLTIEKLTGVEATIKWPNDVLLDGKKVCGILIEQSRGTVVGIGLNVRQSAEDFAAAGLVATSVNQFVSKLLDATDVARTLFDVLDQEYAELKRGELRPLETCWQQHLGLRGKQVVAESGKQVYRGRLRELTFDAVELEQQAKASLRLRPEQVQQLFLG